LAFEAKKYREANELCHQYWLRADTNAYSDRSSESLQGRE
jgi:hypothetical protein